MSQNDDADCHAAGAFAAAVVNFPLWRAGTLLLYGVQVEGQSRVAQMLSAAFKPPYRATFASIFAMTWSRGAIFYGCDRAHGYLQQQGCSSTMSSLISSCFFSSAVQFINTPLIMGTLALQNPQTLEYSIINYSSSIYQRSGLGGLFGGASLVMARSVPKYMAIVSINNHLDEALAAEEEGSARAGLRVLKGPAAAAGAVLLTSPLDALHGEFLRGGAGAAGVLQALRKEGPRLLARGLGANMLAVTIPVSICITVTDLLKSWKYSAEEEAC